MRKFSIRAGEVEKEIPVSIYKPMLMDVYRLKANPKAKHLTA